MQENRILKTNQNTVIILVEKPENLLKENVTHMINN